MSNERQPNTVHCRSLSPEHESVVAGSQPYQTRVCLLHSFLNSYVDRQDKILFFKPRRPPRAHVSNFVSDLEDTSKLEANLCVDRNSAPHVRSLLAR